MFGLARVYCTVYITCMIRFKYLTMDMLRNLKFSFLFILLTATTLSILSTAALASTVHAPIAVVALAVVRSCAVAVVHCAGSGADGSTTVHSGVACATGTGVRSYALSVFALRHAECLFTAGSSITYVHSLTKDNPQC